jgi:hypothetical protein
MKRAMPHTTRAIAIGTSAVAVCLAGTAFASAHGSGSGSGYGYGSGHRSPNGSARQVVSSGGERFLRAGQTVRLGKVGRVTFSASCISGFRPTSALRPMQRPGGLRECRRADRRVSLTSPHGSRASPSAWP